MASINEKDLTNVYVANAADLIQVVDEAGTVLTTLITDPKKIIRIKQTLPSGVIKFSPFFKFGEMFNDTKLDTTPLVEQISFLGYNGTTGALDSTIDTYYGIKIALDHQYNIGNNSPVMKTIPFFSTVATQEHVAKGLMESAIAQFKRDAQRFIKFDRVTDATLTELAADTTVTYNGTEVLSAGHGLTAGQYISLRGATYVVKSATTNDLQLDLPYQGVSEVIVVLSTVDQAASAATITNWGIRFVGVTPVSSFNPQVDTQYVVAFTVQAPDFTAEVTDDTLPTMGSGTYQLVAFDESYAQFHNKDKFVDTYPARIATILADTAKAYDILSFKAVDKVYTSPTTGINPISTFGFTLCFDSGLGNDYDDVDVVLGIS